ncbi:hypothetical protein HNP89_000609 [Methanococcus maripaludis]|uniref:Uncharacterized protein n=1 Tax=Methanococcus maripaludis TaxID=39152 RepID=A0A7J9NY98_METMI|nr:hypothetical protein [Methanococcus maripaludis]MBA2852672.1 hypothetical protein [Methanococcus maripaludis]
MNFDFISKTIDEINSNVAWAIGAIVLVGYCIKIQVIPAITANDIISLILQAL